MTASLESNIFRGHFPNIDRKRLVEPGVIDGQNFIIDLDGPVSFFGKQWLTFQDIDDSRGVQILKDENLDDKYIMGADAILQYDHDSRQIFPVFRHRLRGDFWPWTCALVGTKLYFANFEVGLLEFDYVDDIWKDLTDGTEVNIPSTVFACAASGGRLILLSQTATHYSEIDDGSDAGFFPDTATGAGFQLLSILAANTQPLMVLAYDDGFLTYCGAGIIRSALTNTDNPFRHTVLTKEIQVINAWCARYVVSAERDEHILLTKRGLYKTDGKSHPIPWQLLISEHLHTNVFPQMVLSHTQMDVRLDDDFSKGWFIISISVDSQSSLYTKAFVNYTPNEEDWGVYNQAHHGFVPITIDSDSLAGEFYCVVDVAGTIHYFTHNDHNSDYPAANIFNVDYKTHFDMPAQFSGDLTGTKPSIFPCMISMNTETLRLLSVDKKADIYNLIAVSERALSPLTVPQPPEDDIATEVTTVDEGLITAAVDLFVDEGLITNAADVFVDEGQLAITFSTAMGMQTAIVKISAAGFAQDEQTPLNASVLIGPFLFPRDVATPADLITQTQQLIISMLDSPIADTLLDYIDDFIDAEVIEDWNDNLPDEDWGVTAAATTEYALEFIGTIDAYTTWRPEESLEQFVVPFLVSQDNRTRIVSGVVSGRYILLNITAFKLGESFHLKHLKFDVNNAGRYH